MATPVLVTKLFVPCPRPNLVPRPRLIERLDEGLHRSLSLISAPAGWGKTTLVSAWLAGSQRPSAWLSLDEGDNNPARFLVHVVAAVQTIAPECGVGALSALQSAQPPPIEAILTSLLNDIAGVQDAFILVLDDYHVIDSDSIDRAVTFILEHLPPQLHLVMTTREDPQLSLTRLRVRDRLTEMRSADLGFTPAEAAEFLNQVMGLTLSEADVSALGERTEGWIAGLQLAALSLQDHQDVSGFIQAFAGDHRYVADYLVEEVLQRQPEDVRRFLLQTAILDRLTGPLCDAVTGQKGGAARLEALERGNFFLVPLDDQRRWYRYHHLFADVLAAHVKAEQPEEMAALHRRASQWYERHGSIAYAIRHALAGEDLERAASLVELALQEMRRTRQEARVLGWLEALPEEVVHCRPVLSAAYAQALLVSGRLEGVESRLQEAERWLDTTADTAEMVVVDHEEFRRLPAEIAIYRAAIAQARGEVAETMRYARQALDRVPEEDDLIQGSAAGFLALATWASGDLETAHRMYGECMTRVRRVGYLADSLGCALALADIRIRQGRLSEAMRTYEQAIQLPTDQSESVLRGTADMYVGMSELYRERNDLDAATKLLLTSRELGELAGLRQNPYRWRVAMARLQVAHGDLDDALDLLGEAERLYASDFFPNVCPVAAVKARVWIAQGRVGEALRWAWEQGLSTTDDLSYLREFEHITLARALLARCGKDQDDSLEEAIGLLHRLLQAAEDGERMGSVIECLVLLALAHRSRDDIPAALTLLQRGLTLAEPEGYVRMFVDEGPSMAALLQVAIAYGILPVYAGKLLRAFRFQDPMSADVSQGPTALAPQPTCEPLSQRELDVLRLFNSDLSGPEIARELVVALSTVRTHTKSIYGKLGVDNRRAAVRRASELGLI